MYVKYMPVDTLFQSFCFLRIPGHLWWWVAANKNVTEPSVLSGKVEFVSPNVVWSPYIL